MYKNAAIASLCSLVCAAVKQWEMTSMLCARLPFGIFEKYLCTILDLTANRHEFIKYSDIIQF